MGRQSMRQKARKEAVRAQAERLAAKREREERLSELGIQVMTDLGEGQALLEQRERDAAKGVRDLQAEGLSLREVLTWLGPEMTQAEVKRLLALLDEEDEGDTGTADDSRAAEDDEAGMKSAAPAEGGAEEVEQQRSA